jgi:hypothetical protein
MILVAVISAVLMSVVGMVFDYNRAALTDRFLWPESGRDRIENLAAMLRRNRNPGGRCYSSENPENIYEIDPMHKENDFRRCVSSIAPVSEFQETMPGYYIKRFYRAEIGDKFCEFTLSTVYEDDRIVGADCYFGFFPKAKDTGIGMTDDKFG